MECQDGVLIPHAGTKCCKSISDCNAMRVNKLCVYHGCVLVGVACTVTVLPAARWGSGHCHTPPSG